VKTTVLSSLENSFGEQNIIVLADDKSVAIDFPAASILKAMTEASPTKPQ
jgi:hypothetical protein